MSAPPSVVLHDLSFAWPDGTPVLSHVSGSFSSARTGLIGANGAGKSTLLRLIAGHLTPTGGTITTTGTVDYLPQDATRGSSTTADLLGITAIRRALRAVERGSTDPAHFDTIGDDWTIEERAVASLSVNGLPTDLDRPVTELSGGEAMSVAVTGIHLRGADIALLDEPTNNLDRTSRKRLYDVISGWRGTLIVVSHDQNLLDLLDATAELRAGELTVFGGPYREFSDWLRVQQEAAAQRLRTAEQASKRQQRERIAAEERIAHSERQGRKDRETRKFVGAALNDRRNSAEKAQGKRRASADDRVQDARAAAQIAQKDVRDDEALQIDLPDPGLHRSRRVVELPSADGRHVVIQGPERVGLVGDNGVGKTTLLEAALPKAVVRTAYLPQRILLDEQRTVLDTMRDFTPGVAPGELRNRLARLLIRGDMVDRPVGTLSGGERFRLALARLVLAEPPPELLVLDEPTNDLDFASVDQLVTTLAAYRGALLAVSHDLPFLERLRLDTVLRLGADGVLSPDT